LVREVKAKVKIRLSPSQAVEAYRAVRCWWTHVVWTIDSQSGLKRWRHSTPQKHYFSASGTHFCYRLSKPQGLVRLEGLGKVKKSNDLIGTQTGYVPAYSTVPQSLRYHVVHRPLFGILYQLRMMMSVE
jgi:hypothetical protein